MRTVTVLFCYCFVADFTTGWPPGEGPEVEGDMDGEVEVHGLGAPREEGVGI